MAAVTRTPLPPTEMLRLGARRMRPVASVGFMLGVLAMSLALIFAGCTSKSEADLANEALNAGLAAHSAGNLDEATRLYREVLKHDPQNKFAFYNLGLIDQTQGRLPSAENNYRIALNIDPEFQAAIWNLALVRAAQGGHQEAVDLWHRYLGLADAAGAHYNLALALRALGQQAEGDAEMQRAIEMDPAITDPGASATAPSGGASPAPSAS